MKNKESGIRSIISSLQHFNVTMETKPSVFVVRLWQESLTFACMILHEFIQRTDFGSVYAEIERHYDDGSRRTDAE